MIQLKLQRHACADGATLGELYVDGVKACDTLEDLMREAPGEPVSAWKVPGATAIPAGRYPVTLVDSPRFGPDTFSVGDVPGFKYVRIHAGNDADDTEGCILVGVRLHNDYITMSRATLSELKAALLARMKAGEACEIEVCNP